MIFSLWFSFVLCNLSFPVFAKVDLDRDHFSAYPYCGQLFGYGRPDATSRVVNSKDSKIQYPWVVAVLRRVLHVDKRDKKKTIWLNFECAGTVLTDRHVVTAGHCICNLRKRKQDDEPDPHEKALCKPSEENIFYSKYKNQIRKGYNEIVVYGGDMDLDKMVQSKDLKYTFEIAKAYAKNRATNDRFDGKSDIGVLVSERSLFDREALTKAEPFDKPLIVPICLAAKGATFVGEQIRGVGWGLRYDESPGEPEKPYVSSCMTNEVGPEKWRFHNCNMKKIIDDNYSCEKRDLPPNIQELDREKCKAWFRKTRDESDRSQIQFKDEVSKIHIYSTKEGNKLLQTCYDDRQFTENGWCIVHNQDLNKDPEAWGFCSPSCDSDLMKRGSEERYPKIYQEIDWKESTSRIGRNHPCYWGFYHDEYDICMEITLPRATVGHLKTPNSFWSFEGNIDSIVINPDIEFNQRTSYRSICNGDSGAGQWVTIDEDGSSSSKKSDGRSALVAVARGSSEEKFNVNGRQMNAVCGGNMMLDDGDLLTDGATAVRATHPVISKFIKKYAKIVKSKSK